MVFASPFAKALSHLLEAEPWARERLAPFAGESLELRAPPLPRLRFAITTDGRLEVATADPTAADASLVVTLKPEALAAAFKGSDHLLRSIEIAGNARLASEVLFLVRHLRWDIEEDLAKVVGDVAAHRLVALAGDTAAWHADAAQRVAAGFVEYALEERRVLVKRSALEEFSADSARLRDGLERLERRVARLVEGN